MRDPDRLLKESGVHADPRRDQHFLIDDRVLDRIPTYLTAVSTQPGRVLEIGAGTGALTDRLLQIATEVIAIERDRFLVEFLRREFADDISKSSLTVIHGDALEIELPTFDACVSNLPYGISSEITFKLLQGRVPLVLMYQREFADRMVAQAGSPEYGRLSVTIQHYSAVEIVETVPRTAFTPAPAVESAIVRLLPKTPDYELADEELFFNLVRAIFTQRRKTLRNAIRNTAHISGLRDPNNVVSALDADLLSRRPGELPPRVFAEIANVAYRVESRA